MNGQRIGSKRAFLLICKQQRSCINRQNTALTRYRVPTRRQIPVKDCLRRSVLKYPLRIIFHTNQSVCQHGESIILTVNTILRHRHRSNRPDKSFALIHTYYLLASCISFPSCNYAQLRNSNLPKTSKSSRRSHMLHTIYPIFPPFSTAIRNFFNCTFFELLLAIYHMRYSMSFLIP